MKRVCLNTTKAAFFIECSKVSWLKVEIPRLKTEQEVFLFTETSLMMSKFGTHTLTKESSPWQMLAQIPMALNFSSFSAQLHT